MCIPRFEKLKEELRQDRIHALIHMDCGKKNDKYGHYAYLTRRGIDMLNRYWREKKLRLYGKCVRKCGGFFGDIPYMFNEVFDEEKYNRDKDNAIASIGNKGNVKERDDLNKLKHLIGNIQCPISNREKLAKSIGITTRTLLRWANLDIKTKEIAPPLAKDNDLETDIYNNGVEGGTTQPELINE